MYKDYYWLNEKSRTVLSRGYLPEGQAAESRIRHIAETAEEILGIPGFADKFEGYMKRGYYSLASPVWANFGLERGLPISCNGSYVGDDMASILGKVAEVGMMSKHGSGTSGYFGALRRRGANVKGGGRSGGPVHFMEIFDTTTEVVSQSGVRRGNFAAYLPLEHPDIDEFLQIRNDGHAIQHMSIGVTVTDAWMEDMIAGDKDKRKLWAKVIEKRFASGYPYIMFIDTVNNNAPQAYKDKGKRIHASNLCSEICLSSEEDESFVCDLSSMNLFHYDEWKDTDAVETMIHFLDAVMTEYIRKVKDIPFMQAAYNFAVRQRALGLGVLGWHSYLQSKMIAFESFEAKMKNVEIFKLISTRSYAASQWLADKYGEPELLKGYRLRNLTQMAVAPTKSSSFILGGGIISQSIEPWDSNYYVQDIAKGKFTIKNPWLKDVLKAHNKNTPEVWQSILKHGGSVQHLEFLTQHEKDVFKTFGEISQKEIVIQASQRQKFIDQSQSLNLKIHPDTPMKEVNALLIEGWRLGVKTFYYQKGTNPSQELSRNLLSCTSCEA